MGMGAGALISISTFLKPISTDFGWLRGETAFAYLAGAVAMGFGGIAMGYLSDRYSTRPVPFTAGLLIASYGWRDAYTILGIACMAGMLPLTLINRRERGGRRHSADPTPPPRPWARST